MALSTLPTDPRLLVQTASLWASGDSSVFSPTGGGPWGYDPFFGQFADVVNSTGLDAMPYGDQLWNVEAGDEVVFVVVVQNKGPSAAYDILLRDVVPAGFAAPEEGAGVTATDGAGNLLATAGDLFDASGGLQILDPVGANDPDTGADIVLVTFVLQATAALAVPAAGLSNTAQIVAYAAEPGGANLAAHPSAGELTASTGITTSLISATSAPDQNRLTLRSGQQASFDITITIPAGEVRDLRVDEIFPHMGGAWLHFVRAEIVSRGADISVANASPIQTDGSVAFGTVVNSASGQGVNAESMVVRLTVEGDGTAAGQGVLETRVSALDPNVAGGRWSATLIDTLALEAPNVAPTIGGTRGGQNATNTMQIHPFAAATLTDPDAGQVQTLRIHLSDPLFGTLSGVTGLAMSGGDYVLSGGGTQLQQGLRDLVFATGPGRSGTETFTLTLDDGAGGVATDGTTAVTIAAAAPEAATIQHFPLSPTGTVLTATASGSQTVAQVEQYQGPVDYLQSQFIYDGTTALAIVAQSPNMFIKNVAGSTAVQLLAGQNVVDAGHGSNFLLGGTGQDVFFLDGRQHETTWDTIVGFHAGDIATLWGFKDGVSRYWWDDSAGAQGYTGLTLRADLTGSGNVDASLTFTGATPADLPHFVLTTGGVGGNDYMAIFAV